MLDRNSTTLLNFLGVQTQNTFQAGQMQTQVINGTGTQVTSPPDSKLLSNLDHVVVASVPTDQYFYAQGYFEAAGAPPTTAATLALLLTDVAQTRHMKVQNVIDKFDSSQGLNFDNLTYIIMNILRPQTNQVGTVTNVNNNNSYQARSILP